MLLRDQSQDALSFFFFLCCLSLVPRRTRSWRAWAFALQVLTLTCAAGLWPVWFWCVYVDVNRCRYTSVNIKLTLTYAGLDCKRSSMPCRWIFYVSRERRSRGKIRHPGNERNLIDASTPRTSNATTTGSWGGTERKKKKEKKKKERAEKTERGVLLRLVAVSEWVETSFACHTAGATNQDSHRAPQRLDGSPRCARSQSPTRELLL